MSVRFTDHTPTTHTGKSTSFYSIRKSTRRYTPYGNTPQSRRLVPLGNRPRLKKTPQRKGSKARPSISIEEEITDLKGLTFKTWKLYKLTPLYKFPSNPKDLKKTSNILSARIKAESQKGTFIDIYDDAIVGKAIISQYKGMKISQNDPEGIQILIQGQTKNLKETVVLTAVLCGVDMIKNLVKQSMQDKFSYYPIMLVKGSVSLTDVLNGWLETQYDCKVTPLTFSSYDLTWMVSMWSGLDDSETKKKPVELVYSVPDQCEGLDKITLTIDPADCRCLWQSIHGDEEEFTGEEVRLFISSLESHFYTVFKIHLSAMQLRTVGTPLCYIGSEGRLKLFMADNVLIVLRHLTELAMERTFSFNYNN